MAEGGKDEKPTYGNCDGPDSEYIKLISSDGFEFIVKREHAYLSSMIKTVLTSTADFPEKKNNEIHFKEIPGRILQKAISYLIYKAHYSYRTGNIPKFHVQPEIALELLMAATFLDV